VEAQGFFDGLRGVVGDVRRDLQRDVAVEPVRPLEDRHEDVAGVPDILAGELPEDLLWVVQLLGELL
jgi:hypothetical protein